MSQESNNNQDTINSERNEFLRTEYLMCQQAADGQSLSHWAFAGIFLGLSTAGFAAIIQTIFSNPNCRLALFITFVSVGMLVMFFALDRMLARTSKYNSNFYNRMREIEAESKIMIIEQKQKKVCGIKGRTWWRVIIFMLSMFWILMIIFVWIECLIYV